MANVKNSGNTTAQRAGDILVAKEQGFVLPTGKQKKNLVIAFAKRVKIVYGKAFDIIKLSGRVDLDILQEVESKLDRITLYEIKSTARDIEPDFKGYFFGLTAAEVLVSQSLKAQFKFVFVNIHTRNHIELSLSQMFGRAKGIYPTWSILF